MKFNEKIQALRKQKHLSQEEFGDRVGVSRQSVYKWEAGQSYPDTEKLLVISRIFNVSTDYLLKDEMEDPNPDTGEEKSSYSWNPERKRRAIAYSCILFDVLAYGILWIISRIWPQVYLQLNYFENDPEAAYVRTGVSALIYSRDLFGLVVVMAAAAFAAAVLLIWNRGLRKGWIKKCAGHVAGLDKTKLDTSVFDDAKEYPFSKSGDSETEEGVIDKSQPIKS